jgi:hypothetical protein
MARNVDRHRALGNLALRIAASITSNVPEAQKIAAA